MVRHSPNWQLHHTLILLVILLGLVIRFHGLVWTLPYHFNGDETRIISNGITVYQEGAQAYSGQIASMTNYPPLRGWEIAGVRAIMMGLGGISNGEQVLWGRMFSLFYALLTIALLYQLGKTVSNNPYVGIVAALLFAVWQQIIDIGQRTLSDGTGMMFFVLCAWLSVLAYRRFSYRLLVLAIVAGILAGLGKYNFFPALAMPALAGFAFLLRRPKILLYAAIPSVVLAIPILYFASKTLSGDTLYYSYLNDTAQLEGELRYWQVRGYSPDSAEWQAVYNRYPLTVPVRLMRNYDILMLFMPSYVLPLTLIGVVGMYWLWRRKDKSLDQWSLGMLALTGIATLVSFSLFRLVEGRHLYGAIVIALVFAGLGVTMVSRFSRIGAMVLVGLMVVPMGIKAWSVGSEFTKPDTRIATIHWLLDNARDGSGVAIENEPYEFWDENGYSANKHFNVVRTYRLWDKEPQQWELEGFYYLVADRTYEWRGGFYAGHEKAEFWMADVEEVARFEGDAYDGPDRIIFRVFKPQVKVDADFGDLVNFYGYNVESQTLHAGDTLRFKYFWKSNQSQGTPIDYTIFNHLVNVETGETLIQFDRLAGHNGTKPSSQWDENEWLFDTFELTIPEDAPAGDYIFQMGLYNSADGVRLPVVGGENGVLQLFEVTITTEESDD